MTPRQIKASLLLAGISHTEIARRTKTSSVQVSFCVHGYRVYPRIRRAIAKALNTATEEVFDHQHPRPEAQRIRHPALKTREEK